jgi:hypothetical protein
MTWEQFEGYLASTTHPRRVMTLEGDGKHGGLHGVRQGERDDGTTVNLTMGSLDD